MERPVTSDGSRSGVNWIRRNVHPRLRAMAFGEDRLARAGHVLDQQVAAHRSATSASRTSWCLPTMTRSTFADNAFAGLLDLRHSKALAAAFPERGTPGVTAAEGSRREGVAR
jgi:hypothetical protein